MGEGQSCSARGLRTEPGPFPPVSPQPSPVEKGRYVRGIYANDLPSPWMGEGQGGGEAHASPPIPPFPRQGGRRTKAHDLGRVGSVTSPCLPVEGEGISLALLTIFVTNT